MPILKEASRYLPGNLEVRRTLAEAYLQQEERSKAFTILQELLRHYPADPTLLLVLDAQSYVQLRSAREGKPSQRRFLDEAEALLAEGLLDEAEALLRRARRKGKSERLDWLELQLVFRRNPEKALSPAIAFAQSEHHARLCFLALRWALEYLMAQNREAEIEKALEAFLAKHPKSSGAWEAALMRQAYRLLRGKLTEEDLREVRRLYRQPLPGLEGRARTLLGQYLLSMKRPQELVDLLAPVIEKEPTLIVHFQLGAALAALGESRDAEQLLKAGLEAPPGDLDEAQTQGIQNQIQALLQELNDVKSKA